MSPRVTRSASKQSANPPATSDHNYPTSTSARKRKLPPKSPSSEESANSSSPQTKRPRKGARVGEASVTAANMSSSKAPDPPPDDGSSPPPPAASSRKKSGKGKKPSQEQPQPSSSGSKPHKPSTSKKRPSSSKKEAAPAAQSEPPKLSEQPEPSATSPPEEPSPPDDDFAGEDSFAQALLGRHVGPEGIPSTLRALKGMMTGMSSRLRTILDNLRSGDPTMQDASLRDLCEVLSFGNEDSLSGQFAPESYVKELVKLMQPSDVGDFDIELMSNIMLHACRCLAYMIESLPATTSSVVFGGAVPVLVEKLLNIEFMDVAEQALSTLEKISAADFGASIVREGGLTACLQYLDFFATPVQQTAVTTAANCCQRIPWDSIETVKSVMPNLLNVLNGNETRVVEQGCLCVCRIVESFKFRDENIEELMNADFLRTILRLLLPSSGNNLKPTIHTQFLRVLSATARASPALSVELFKMNITDTLFQILTGVSPPNDEDDVAPSIDSVMVMQSLIHLPRDQVLETLEVICTLLPGIDKGGLSFLDEVPQRVGSTGGVTSVKSEQSTVDKRRDRLTKCQPQLRRFATILLPTLTDAFSSTVNLGVREKVLSAQLKMLSNLDTPILEDALRSVPYASFLASILSQQDHPLLVTAALQAADLLLKRLGSIYRNQFYREGVFAEIRKLGARDVSTQTPPPTSKAGTSGKDKTSQTAAADSDGESEDSDDADDPQDYQDRMDEDDDSEASPSDSDGRPPPPRASAGAMPKMQDMITRAAKKFIDQHETCETKVMREKANQNMEDLQNLMSDIAECYDDDRSEEGSKLFSQLASHFKGDALESITSYELLSSNIVDHLLEVLGKVGHSGEDAKSAFVEVFMGSAANQKIKTSSSSSPTTPFSVLIQKLQDLLSRAEHFEVLTVHSSPMDNVGRSAYSALGKHIRIPLAVQGDESKIPEEYRKFAASIPAIATFKSLDEHIRQTVNMPHRHRLPHHRGPYSAAMRAAMAEVEETGRLLTHGTTSSPSVSHAAASSSSSGAQKTPRPTAKPKDTGKSAKSTTDTVTGSAEKKTPARRRSARFGTQVDPQPSVTGTSAKQAEPSSPSQRSPDGLEVANETHLSDDEDMNDDGDLGAIVDEMEEEVTDSPRDPSTVNMEVEPTGTVTAHEDDGTRVDTPPRNEDITRTGLPAHLSGFPGGLSRSFLARYGQARSYSAAAQAIPQDFHLEFSINGRPLSRDWTIYRGIHMNQISSSDGSERNIWSSPPTIDFKRVSGPPPEDPKLVSLLVSQETESTDLPESLTQNPISATILRLLRILHEMNSNLEDVLNSDRSISNLNPEPAAQFVNTKLTAKMNRQLEEPLIVGSQSLPPWSKDLAKLYPFLFPFETRYLFLQSTSFGIQRAVSRWEPSAEESRNSRISDRFLVPRLSKQKVRIARGRILDSAVKVLDDYGSKPPSIEVEYFNEEGVGLGPTLEFYTLVSREFAKKRLHMWRNNESNQDDEHVFSKQGLFPAPMSDHQIASDYGQKVIKLFATLGKFVARSMLDSRIIDLSFNPIFFRINSGGNAIKPSLGSVKAVDQGLAQSLQTLRQYLSMKKKITDSRLAPAAKSQKIARIQVSGARIDELSLDFTLPGYPQIELKPRGSTIAVDIDNVGEYIDAVIDYTLSKGVHKQLESFKKGFSAVFPYSSLSAFTPDELVNLFGRVEEDWSIETLTDSIKVNHGYNLDSQTVRNLLQAMTEMDLATRRNFLQFITGSPKLPIGGFKALTPMFTVVRRGTEPGRHPDESLPSCMTCVNYLKMPDYSSLEVMKMRLGTAIKEGQGAFNLT